MQNILNISSLNFDYNQFLVNINKKLSKKEQDFLEIVLNKIDINLINSFIKVEKNSVLNKLSLKTNETLNKFSEKLLNKSINYKILNDQDLIFSGNFNLFTNISEDKDFLYLMFAEEIRYAYKSNNIFNQSRLNILIKFRQISSLKLFQEILKHNNKEFIEYDIDSLKTILELDKSYSRFYDFEKNVLVPTIKEINKYTDFIIEYEKIKNGHGKTCKVVGLRFKIFNKNIQLIHSKSTELMSKIKKEINDFEFISHLIAEYLTSEGYDYVNNNIDFSLEHSDNDFDQYLEEALFHDYYTNHFNMVTAKSDNSLTLLVNIEKHFATIFNLESTLYKELSRLGFHYDFEFVQVLHQLKIKNRLEYRNEFYKIIVEYNKKGDSGIKIYKL